MNTPSPAKGLPQRVVLAGRYARLEPLGPQHADDLWHASVPDRFAYLFSAPPVDANEMRQRTIAAAGQSDPLAFAVVDAATGNAEGQQSLMRITPEHGVIEIGSIYWGPALARTRKATEALYLHARYVFDELRYRRFEWKCNDLNVPSKRAAERFGFSFEGVFRQHMIVKGASRDTAWFAIIDRDWPRLRAEYERWLEPDNFDAAGQQKTALSCR